jgi:hypothetical protein
MRRVLALAAAILLGLAALTLWGGDTKHVNDSELTTLYEKSKTATRADFARHGTPATIDRSTTSSPGSSHGAPDTSTRDVTVTTAIGCALTITLTPGATLPRVTTVPCVQHG